jgi:hypothetical protein
MYEKLFALASIATPFWLLMILLPSWRVSRFLANTVVFPIFLAVLYAVGIITAIEGSGIGFVQDFGSAKGVISRLSNPDFALLVWLHLLCTPLVCAFLRKPIFPPFAPCLLSAVYR